MYFIFSIYYEHDIIFDYSKNTYIYYCDNLKNNNNYNHAELVVSGRANFIKISHTSIHHSVSHIEHSSQSGYVGIEIITNAPKIHYICV